MIPDVSFEPLRVFVIEDEAIVLMQLEMLLEEAGHIIVGNAMSADEALPLIAALRPELVFLDIQLKDGSSGLDVARAVREFDDITVVLVTANAGMLNNDLEGAAAIIAKPFNEK